MIRCLQARVAPETMTTITDHTLSEVVQAMKKVRVIDRDGPFQGELRLMYYDGYVQKGVHLEEIPTA